jgi:hypothetical protein
VVVAEPVGNDETFTRGMEKARAALGPRARSRPRSVPEPVADLTPPPTDDEAAARIAELEAEIRALRATLARIHDQARAALDP